jgi:hypothetical protein
MDPTVTNGVDRETRRVNPILVAIKKYEARQGLGTEWIAYK